MKLFYKVPVLLQSISLYVLVMSNNFDKLIMKVNSFQVLLATDVSSTYVIFFYEDIQWSESTVIGFNSGDMSNGFNVPGTFDSVSGLSLPSFVLDIENEGNTGIGGLYLYRVDGDFIFDSQSKNMLLNLDW